MKSVIRYLSDDGNEYETPEKARAADKLHVLKDWYEEHEISADPYYPIAWEDLVGWIREHPYEVSKLVERVVALLKEERAK